MSRQLGRTVALAAVLAIAAAPAWGQFRYYEVSYERFDWQVYSSPHFDVHYYPGMEPFLEDVVSYAESAYLRIARDLDHELRFRVPLIIFKTRGEYRQTHIAPSYVTTSAAAFSESTKYRMVLPIDMPADELYNLVSHELVHIFQYSIFYEGYLGRALRSNPPYWLMEGMASYLADDENNIDRMTVRDAVANNRLPLLEELSGLSWWAYRYGNAIYEFIEQEHGKEGLRSFIFEYKKVLLANNLEKAIKEAFGYDIDEFNRRFNRYLRKKYFPVLLEKKSPDDYGSEIAGKFRRGTSSMSPAISPSGELIAALSSKNLELDLIVLSAEDGSLVKNLTKGWTNKYSELVAEIYDGKRDLAWSPTADQVAVFARKENRWPLLIFNSLRGRLDHKILFDDIVECSSPTFSPDGERVAFEGNRDGVVDIFEVDLSTGALRNVTQDDFFDANPWYSVDGSSLLYNRRIGSHWKIFSVDLSDPSKKTQLTFDPHSDIQPSYSRDGQTVYFSSDRGQYGIFNLHALDLATGDVMQYTDVVGGCFGPVEMAERDGEPYLAFTAYFQGSFRLYRMPLRSPELEIKATERLAEAVEAKPFEPELRLRVDDDKNKPYKARWGIEVPYISVGVANDGTFLTNAGVQFSDLMGDQRIMIMAGSVSDYGSYMVSYSNLRHRLDWGAVAFDQRNYFVDYTSGQRVEQLYRYTGANFMVEYPFSRHYSVGASLGVLDASIPLVTLVPEGDIDVLRFQYYSDRLALSSLSLSGDTSRWQSFGPFQGKRFEISANYGRHLSGDFEGDWLEYRVDFRAYKQLTRRSLLAWRIASVYNAGDREYTYGFGGMNQLRGYDFLEFFGSRIAWSNLEFRFPLVDEIRFPIFYIPQIRGFLFLDVGAAWYKDGLWYDSVERDFRADAFEFWDSDNNRLQDGRASYGVGFQFRFIGGLQFNWVWSRRFDYTQLTYPGPVKEKADSDGTRSDFYIQFDF